MQKSLTWLLLACALLVFGLILILESRVPGTRERQEPARLFPQVDWNETSSIKITLASGEVVLAERTNHTWMLRNPTYPAQQAAVESFLTNLASIRRLDWLAPHEVALQGAKSFGFEPARGTIELSAGTNRIQIEVGGRAPLTNNFYLRVPSSGEVVLASAQASELLPASSVAWRDPRLLNFTGLSFDHLRVRTGQRLIELARDATNGTWRIARPVPARASQERVAGLMETLRTAAVRAYVVDSPADLERFGLQSPELEVALLNGTNRVSAVEFGAPVTNRPDLVYARLLGTSNVAAVPSELAELLRQPYRNFLEPQFVNFRPGALDRIIVHSTEEFTLQREPAGRWTGTHAGKNIPIDPLLLGRFLTNLLAIEILDIVKEVPTDADLKAFGLLAPRVSIALFERLTNSAGALTNILFSEISFGTNQADRVLARRSDEIPVYAAPLGQLLVLPDEAFELRDRQIWSIAQSNVVQVSLANGAGTNTLQRGPNGSWSDDPILNEAIGEAVLRLCELQAVEWTSKGEARKRALGIRENPLTLTVQTSNESYTVQFGTETMQRNVYAAVNLPDESEPVLFQFPGLLFYSLLELLPVPK